MATIPEMRARLAEIKERLEAIHSEFGERALDEERQTEWTELDAEYDSVSASLKAAEKREERMAQLAAEGKLPTERGSDSGPAFIKTRTDVELYDLNALRMESNSAEDYVQRATDNAKRAIERASYGVRSVEDAQGYAEDLLDTVDNSSGELAKRMLATGSKEYERAFTKIMRHGNDAMCTNEERQALIRANQHLGTDTEGGYAVPFQLDPTVILTSAGVVNPIRQLARVEKIVGKEWQGVTSEGVSVVRGLETTTAPNTEFTLDQPVVRTNRVQGFVQFSMEIDLSWNALRSEITKMLIDAKGREEDSFITGTGDGLTLSPEGINGALTGQDVELDVAASGLQVRDIYALEEALDARWEANASWLAHKSVYNKIRQFDSSGGANLWVRIGDGTPARLLDYPDYRSTALPSYTSAIADADGLGAAAALMIFGDFSKFLIVDRIGMNVEMVPHVFDGANGNRPTGRRGVYAVWMNNSKILVPGAFKRLIKGDEV